MTIRQFVATKCFIEYDGKVLLLQESDSYAEGTNKGRWDVAGGRVAPGESFQDCLKREVMEETGLPVHVRGPFYVDEWWPMVNGEQWQVIGIFFIAQAESDGVTLSKDHARFAWVAPESISKYPMAEEVQRACAAYLAVTRAQP